MIKGHNATNYDMKPCITTCLYTILQVKVTMWVKELFSGNLRSPSAFLVYSVRSHMGRQRVISFLLLFYLLSKFPESPARGDTVLLHKHSEAIAVCPCTASAQWLPQGAQTPLFCQRSFLLGCPAPIRQGCLDVKDTQGT